MSTEIAKAISKFGCSEPIFKGYRNGHCIEFVIAKFYNPSDVGAISNDPLDHIIVNHYHERFDRFTLSMNTAFRESNIFASVMRSVTRFYETNSPLSKPMSSKTYRWLQNVNVDDVAADGIIHLCRYISTDQSANVPKNFLAILEMMREKYER